jgi:hypothetical protein
MKIQTNIFSEYLAKKNMKLINNHYYVLIPSKSCINCVKSAIEKIIKVSHSKHLKNITFVTSNNFVIHDFSIEDFIYDDDRVLDYLNLDLGNLNILFIENNSIVLNHEISLNNIESIDKILKN